MITFKNLAKAIALAALLALVAPQAAFAGAMMCRNDLSGGATGPATIGGTGSKVPSATLYTLNGQGCAWIVQQDVAFFQSQGYTPGGNVNSVSVVGLTAQSTTANSPILPAGSFITGIIVQETSGNAVTGGLDIGIAGSSDQTIVAAYAIGANALVAIPAASILKNVFATTSVSAGLPKAQQIFFNAHTNWTDGATINVTILYSQYEPF